AISLNIGGVNAYRGLEGHITVMYVAPWAPDQGISCAMGYGMTLPKRRSAILVLPLGFAHPAVVARPFPWAESAWAAREHLSLWELRDWQGWLADRLQLPFPALVPDLSSGELAIATVAGILRVSADEARRQGIHFDCRLGGSALTLGATALTPCDIASPNAALLAEYHAYRERVGPPPDHYRPAPRLLLPGGPREWRRE
ncbi:MAG: hypothetical protein HY721_06340, partial [Planctomycetes bacterium]|nr:hypothetical protein [Planctomycetota bacterium]